MPLTFLASGIQKKSSFATGILHGVYRSHTMQHVSACIGVANNANGRNTFSIHSMLFPHLFFLKCAGVTVVESSILMVTHVARRHLAWWWVNPPLPLIGRDLDFWKIGIRDSTLVVHRRLYAMLDLGQNPRQGATLVYISIVSIYGIFSSTFLLEIFMVVFHCLSPSTPRTVLPLKKLAPAMENPMQKLKPNELLWLVPLTTCTTTFTPPKKKNPILAPSTPTYRKTLHAQPPSPLSPFGEPGDLPSTTPLRLFA